MRVLILGATGMLGSATLNFFAASDQDEAWGTIRDGDARRFFVESNRPRLIDGLDVLDEAALASVIRRVKPDVVINAVGVIKQLEAASDPGVVLPINATFPHRLAALCGDAGARMVQISSDCVFSGRVGHYLESDAPDAEDLYGKSKLMGEVVDQPHVITLRTSVIGHELASTNSLVDWFLSQHGQVRGYANAIYSGLPSVELARVIRDFVLPNKSLFGLYHVSSKPIAKFDLLTVIARVYKKSIAITPDDSVRIDRSLDSRRFTAATGYIAPEWPELVAEMHDHRS